MQFAIGPTARNRSSVTISGVAMTEDGEGTDAQRTDDPGGIVEIMPRKRNSVADGGRWHGILLPDTVEKLDLPSFRGLNGDHSGVLYLVSH
jgi:hypothetical protein